MNINFQKNRDGSLDIVDVATGIGLRVWDSTNLVQQLNREPAATNPIERQLREALKVIATRDPTLGIKLVNKEFTYTPERIETVWQ